VSILNLLNNGLVCYFSKYSKTPIYRASQGKGKKPGKLGDGKNQPEFGLPKVQNYQLCDAFAYMSLCFL
jgi:hypothetical protein